MPIASAPTLAKRLDCHHGVGVRSEWISITSEFMEEMSALGRVKAASVLTSVCSATVRRVAVNADSTPCLSDRFIVPAPVPAASGLGATRI